MSFCEFISSWFHIFVALAGAVAGMSLYAGFHFGEVHGRLVWMNDP
jgi:hypothetical protein